MASQSPQRTRKALQQQPQLQQHTGPATANVRREASPSPSLRERQRYARTQSMPIVASVHDPADVAQSQSQTQGPQIGYPRPIPLSRVAPPQFLAHGQAEKWQMTDDLQAEIERADLLQQQQQQHSPPAPGTAGVAYAGGAASAVAFVGHMKTHSTGSVSVGTDPMEAPTARRRMSAEQAQHRASPLSYALRKTANTSPGYPSMPSPRSTKNRTPDRSLPVQEEPDDHEQGRVSPAPSSDLNPTKDLDHDAEGTLVDLGDDDDDTQNRPSGESTEGEGSHTPRSPTNVLFQQGQSQRSIHDVLQPDKSSKSFNQADFQHTLKKLQAEGGGAPASSSLPPPPHPPFSRNEYSRNESRGSYPNWMFDFYHNYPEEIEYYDEAAYMQQFLPAPIATQGMHLRPDAPIPPTPHSQTSAPTPFPNQQNGNGTNSGTGTGTGQSNESVQRTLVPPFSPAPPSGTPYPYPFSHVRRGFVYPPPVPRVASTIYDPSVVQEQLRLQMQMYAYNNGAMTDSTLSPASTPYPGVSPAYTPFGAFLNQSRAFARARAESNVGMNGNLPGEDGRVTSASMRSSPSHLPVPLPPLYPNGRGRERGGLKKRDRFASLRGKVNGALRARPRQRVQVPPRVDSTQPRETSPEPSSGEETAGEKFDGGERGEGDERVGADADAQDWSNGVRHEEEDESGEWVDEDSEDEHELLDLEFHPTYITNPERRRKRWEQRWDELVRAFQALDRETDATLILMASPSHSNTLHSLSSRSIRRDPSLFDGHPMNAARDSFEQIASQRRSTRSQHTSLLERLYASQSQSQSQSGDGSPSSSATGEREEDLRKMLKTALGSLSAVHQMYEVRETRWREEERRMRDERASMDLLIQQALGGAIAAHHPIP